MRTADFQAYSTAAGGAPRRGALLPKVVVFTTLGAALFYGGSVAAAQRSPEYKQFFVERVYGGKKLLDYVSTHELKDVPADLRKLHVEEHVSQAADQVRSGFRRITNYVMQNEQVQSTRDEVERRAAELQTRMQDQLAELRAKASEEGERGLENLREKSREWIEQAQLAAGKSLGEAREHAAHVAAELSEQAMQMAKDVRAHLPLEHKTQEKPKEEAPAPPAVYGAPYQERKLVASAEPAPGARLRDYPAAPKLPKLASSMAQLRGSEPIVGQLASTIDELAAFVRDAPAGASGLARGVLESAQADLQQLQRRMDQLREEDAERLDARLAKQAQTFEAELARASSKAAKELQQRDADWDQKLGEIQTHLAATFKGRLAQELETQSAMINERLREEVLARGIELQRKWSREIKAKVDEERAGRLARLDELTSELRNMEQVSIANVQELGENVHLLSFNAAVRALRQAIDGPAAGDENPYVRRTFESELGKVREMATARNDPLIQGALAALDKTGAAADGVESVPTLHEWFRVRVAPRLRSVALLPEHGAGVLSYFASMALSPLLFARKGNVPGSDVASVVARADWHLERQDLDSAARELNQLHGWPKVLAADWLAAARKRLEVDQALDLVDREAAISALLHT